MSVSIRVGGEGLKFLKTAEEAEDAVTQATRGVRVEDARSAKKEKAFFAGLRWCALATAGARAGKHASRT